MDSRIGFYCLACMNYPVAFVLAVDRQALIRSTFILDVTTNIELTVPSSYTNTSLLSGRIG